LDLLTPQEVADRLKLSISAVYQNKDKLGGFYPAGIRVLRFDPEVIDGIMEGSPLRLLAVRIPISGQPVHRPRVQDQGRRQGSSGEPPPRSPNWYVAKGDIVADPARHGMLGSR
jgi:hypothetical protein